MDIQNKMFKELYDKRVFESAKEKAYHYIDNLKDSRVYPTEEEVKALKAFHEPLNQEPVSSEDVLNRLASVGSLGTIAQAGGRYFGFVNGGVVPASLPVKWLSDVWDQCGGLYLTSPINAELEMVCQNWLKDLLGLPKQTVAGFVSGTSMANLSALAAARYQLLKNQGWDINQKGLNGSPSMRIIAHDQVHASIKKTLAMLGFGSQNIEWLPSDEQGRLIPKTMPQLDNSSLVILQAGNANTGAFDPYDLVCENARNAGAWVHIDGAFGLWAAACKKLRHLTEGVAKASSWSVDGHKTLNAPYDSGIVLCKQPQALVSALQATGEYMIFSKRKNPLLTTPELSKRSRAIELWATMKTLGKKGISDMVYLFDIRTKQMEKGLRDIGYHILNEVVFNQVLVKVPNAKATVKIVRHIQQSGVCWCGGTTWKNTPAIRISICSWRTTELDIEKSLEVFKQAFLKFVS